MDFLKTKTSQFKYDLKVQNFQIDIEKYTALPFYSAFAYPKMKAMSTMKPMQPSKIDTESPFKSPTKDIEDKSETKDNEEKVGPASPTWISSPLSPRSTSDGLSLQSKPVSVS
jgi:hypothetical protein